jgi:hypothetical protein
MLAMMTGTMLPAGVSASGAAPATDLVRAGRPDTVPAAAAGPARRTDPVVTVPVITGGQVVVTSPPGTPATFALRPVPGRPSAAAVYRDPGGDSFVMPLSALPFIGRELSPSLFDVSALARDGITGRARIPVWLTFAAGTAPVAPPGVTVTSVRGNSARGYLTAVSSRAFGMGLARRAAGTRAGGSALGGMTRMSLAAPGEPTVPGGDAPEHTVRLRVTGPTGQLNGQARISLFDTDNGRAYRALVLHGAGTIRAPAGHYSAFALMWDGPAAHPTAVREVTRNDFQVSATSPATTVRIAERSAASLVSVSTPRPSTVQSTWVNLDRVAANGRSMLFGLQSSLGPSVPTYVNPQPPAKVGRLRYVLWWVGGGPASGEPYGYDAAFAANQIPASERYVISAGQVAAVHEHFSADPASDGTSRSYFGGAPDDPGLLASGSRGPGQLTIWTLDVPTAMPGNLTEYVAAPPGDPWTQQVTTPDAAYLIADPRTFAAGHAYSVSWAHGPLAPAFGQHTGPWNCQACVAGHTLSVTFTSAGDSEPDHAVPFWQDLGATFAHVHFTLYRGTTKLVSTGEAAGAVVNDIPAAPAAYRAVLTVDASRLPGYSQSTRTYTSVTMRYGPNRGAALPAEDACSGRSAITPCRILPALTVNYQLATNRSNTSTARTQVLHLLAGHASYDGTGSQAPIRSATVSVSFDGGRTWHAVMLTGAAGRYTATWRNPAPGAHPALKVTATDSAGDSITQTIINAYTVGPAAQAPRPR